VLRLRDGRDPGVGDEDGELTMVNSVDKATNEDEVLREGGKHPVGLITCADGRTLRAMERKDLVYQSGLGDWLLTDEGHKRADALVQRAERGEIK
jgi:hypothetical protein